MTEHTGCILAIVGSRDVPKAGALSAIAAALDVHKPMVVVSGGAKVSLTNQLRGLVSIDQEAARMAREAGIQVVEFLPSTFKFHGAGGFAERNMKIADLCGCLVRIQSETTKTYGSGWTADRAEEMGKEVQRYVVRDDGSVGAGTMHEGIFVPKASRSYERRA